MATNRQRLGSRATMLTEGERVIATRTPGVQQEALRRHLAHLTLRNYSPATIVSRQNALVRLAAATRKDDLLQLTVDDLQDWQEHLVQSVTAASRRVYVTHVVMFFAWALDVGLHPGPDPSRVLVVPKAERRISHSISEHDLQSAIGCSTGRVRLMLVLGAYAGLRVGEMARLRREDVREHDGIPHLLVHGKGDKDRMVPLSDFVLAELRAYRLPARGYVFQRVDGVPGPLAASYVSRLIGDHLRSLDIAEVPHSLRHRFATQTYRATPDVLTLQALLGHANLANTQTYLKQYVEVTGVQAVQALVDATMPDRGKISA